MIIKKILSAILLFYSVLLLIGGLIAPVFAAISNFQVANNLYSSYQISCHQQSIRCFWILGYQMAICARCTGIYTGIIIPLGFFLLKNKKPKFYITIILLILGLLEFLIESLANFSGNNIIRFISGILLGSSAGILFLYVLDGMGELINKCILKKV